MGMIAFMKMEILVKDYKGLSSSAVYFRILIVLALTVLESACVSMQTAPDPLKSVAREDASMVVVSITSNTGRIRSFNGLTVQRIYKSDANRSEFVALNQIVPGLARDTSIFVGLLQEGEYEFARFTDSRSNSFLSLSAGSRQLLGRFKVVRGKPVDLGRLILTPANQKVIMGRSGKVTSNKPLLQKFAPEYAELLKGETSDGWLEPRNDVHDNIEKYALSRPVGLSNPIELKGGTILGASRLGSVLIRTPGGQWRVVRSEGLESLLYAKPVTLPNTRMIAVGELNTMLRLSSDGKMLVPIDVGNLPPGNLLFIDGNARYGWYVANQQGNEITLYHSLKLAGGDWQPLCHEKYDTAHWINWNDFWIWHTDRGLGYAISAGKIHQLDYASGEWRTYKAPMDSTILKLVSNPDGSLGVMVSRKDGGGRLFLSRDDGATWVEIKPKYKIEGSPPIQLPSKTMLTLSREKFVGNNELHVSHDGGATWEKCEGYDEGHTLIPLSSGKLLSLFPDYSPIFGVSVSEDEGKTWHLEYTNFDNALNEAQ